MRGRAEPARYRLAAHPAVPDDLAELAVYGPEVVAAAWAELAHLAHGRLTGKLLEEILAASRRNNEQAGLSGQLIYCSDSFLQILEGDLEPLTATYERIAADDRHTELRRLAFAPIQMRRFGEWTMGFDHLDEDRLIDEVPGFRPATKYPLVSASLITNATVAETLLSLYATNV